MAKENKINFKFHDENKTISLFGDIENFPKITLQKDTSLFNLNIKTDYLNYISAANVAQTTLIGYKALSEFSKFKFREKEILFKRTSLLYLLYLFMAYFSVFCLFLIYYSKDDIFDVGQFVKSISKWVLLNDRN